jgi:hypothetical protein
MDYAELVIRCGLDVDNSIVFYDDSGQFEGAVGVMPSTEALRKLDERNNIRYWSKAI